MNETFQGKCPQCGHEEVKPTVKQLHNVMNEYTATVDGKIVTTVMNSLDEVIEGKNGVKWTKVTKNKSSTAVPLSPDKPVKVLDKSCNTVKELVNTNVGEGAIIVDKTLSPALLVGLGTPASEVAGNDKTGVAVGAVIKGKSLMG